ncbi:MAG: 30S ribosomal protein S1, partial [candidate division SR1 bacterium]
NGLVHLSELSQKSVNNPNEVVRLGQQVKVKIILLDPQRRKIGLSMKDTNFDGEETPSAKATPKKGLESAVANLEE